MATLYQHPDNPHNILTAPKAWVNFEFHEGRGDLNGLTRYTRRYKLAKEIEYDSANTPSVVKAMNYLLLGEIE